MSMRGTELTEAPGLLPREELIGAILRLLMTAETSLGTDLIAVKALNDQASVLIGRPVQVEREPVYSEVQALAPWQVKRLANFVTINLGAVIRNADLAAVVQLSPSHLLKAFKQSFGGTPQAYVARRRVQYAKHLMLSTEQPLAQIALACGLADQAHFCRYFRRVTGVAPAQWRRTYRRCAEGVRTEQDDPMRLT